MDSMDPSRPPGWSAGFPWRTASVVGAVALGLMRQPLNSHYVLVLANAFLHPTSLSGDLIVRAAMSSIYTFGPRCIARGFAWSSAILGAPPGGLLSLLHLSLWLAQAVLTFRCFRALSGEDAAAALATLFSGLELPMFLSDYPYSLVKLERTLGIIPLLWGLTALFEGRRWIALAGLWTAMYLHIHPALYVLPFVVLDDGRRAWKDPAARRGAALRLAASAVLALPFVVSVGASAFPQKDVEFARLTMVLNAHEMAGIGTPAADWVFRLESLALAALAARHTRHERSIRNMILALVVCAAFLAAGRLAYAAWTPGARVSGVILRMSGMNALFLPDFFALPLMCLWMTRQARENGGAWPVLLFILCLSWTHDFVLRLAAIGLGACALSGKEKTALTLAVSAAILPVLHALEPGAFLWIVRSAGLRGGLFQLPAFNPAVGGVLLILALAGRRLRRAAPDDPRRAAGALVLAGAIVLTAAAQRLRMRISEARAGRDAVRMEDWIRANTPGDSVIVASPLTLVPDCREFLARAQRSLYACSGYLEDAASFGDAASPMADRLRAMGFDLSRPGTPYQGTQYLVRQGVPDLTPRQAGALARRLGARGYLLTASGGGLSERPAHEEGRLALIAAE